MEDLRGFQKVRLQPGEARDVTCRSTTDDLKFYNSNLEYDWEPGTFFVRIGGNSRDLQSAPALWNRKAMTAATH
jgi:beta-glucosidase